MIGGEHLQLSHKDSEYALFIQKVCDTDAGLYVVRANNSNGTVSSSAILRVKGNRPPPIERIDWIILCALYLTVSLVYQLFA